MNATHLPYDLTRLAKLCQGVLAGIIALEVLFGLSAVYSYVEIQQSMNGRDVPIINVFDNSYWRSDLATTAVAIPYVFVFLFALFINGRWIYRASANAAHLVPSEKRIGPGWAVGWFFVPIANLFFPFKAMRETWNSSTRSDDNLTEAVPGWITLWWFAWILSNILSQVSERMVRGSNDLSDYANSAAIDVVNAPIGIVAALLFRRLIREVSEAQTVSNTRMAEVFA